jgi:hypothetical protein
MTLTEFRASLQGPPPAVSAPLLALWHDAKGDWNAAHKCVDHAEDPDGMWVHAYLHRKEGELGNARYWYARAKRPPAEGALEEEWAAIAVALLEAEP